MIPPSQQPHDGEIQIRKVGKRTIVQYTINGDTVWWWEDGGKFAGHATQDEWNGYRQEVLPL